MKVKEGLSLFLDEIGWWYGISAPVFTLVVVVTVMGVSWVSFGLAFFFAIWALQRREEHKNNLKHSKKTKQLKGRKSET